MANSFVRTSHHLSSLTSNTSCDLQEALDCSEGYTIPPSPLASSDAPKDSNKHSFILKVPSLLSLVEQRTSPSSSRLVSKWRTVKWKWIFRRRFIPFISSVPHPCRLSCCISIPLPAFLCTSSYLLWLQKDKEKYDLLHGLLPEIVLGHIALNGNSPLFSSKPVPPFSFLFKKFHIKTNNVS